MVPLKRFDIFPPDWRMLRRSRRFQVKCGIPGIRLCFFTIVLSRCNFCTFFVSSLVPKQSNRKHFRGPSSSLRPCLMGYDVYRVWKVLNSCRTVDTCIAITCSSLGINRYSCRSRLNRDIEISLSPFTREQFISRERFNCPVPRQSAYCSQSRAYSRVPLFTPAVHD